MSQPQLQHVRCPHANGSHRMAYWQWGEAQAPHLVLCVHGLSRQGRDFDTLASALLARAASAGQRLRVVCPDVAGRGESDWLPNPQDYHFGTYSADMLALLAQLHAQHPITRLDWVGTSMGGLIGLGLAGTPGLPLPCPVRRLVLNDVGPSIDFAGLQRIGQYLGAAPTWRTPQEALAQLQQLSAPFGPHTPAQWQALNGPMLRPADGGGWRLHYDPAIAQPFAAFTPELAAAQQDALWALYDALTAQVLVLRGAHSDVLSAATAHAMTGRGPRAQLREFAGVGHAPMLMAADQIAAVADFVLSE